MKRYCVAYMDYFNNDITQKFILAESERDAMINLLRENGFDTDHFTVDMLAEDIQQLAFNCDSLVSAIEV